jgi:ubiquinol-cytochrome c reductase cytochrome c subunit
VKILLKLSAIPRPLLYGLIHAALLLTLAVATMPGRCQTIESGSRSKLHPAANPAVNSSPDAAPLVDGGAIFAQHCARCHGTRGQGISAVVSIAGPSLRAEHDPGVVITALEVGPSHMPVFSYVLSVPEMHAVANYVTRSIADIPLTGGSLTEGGDLFRTNCAVCHRTAVRGGALAFTGVNAPALTHKSAAIIAGAIRWGPGPMPPFPASILNDQQVASIVQYVKFVQHPPDPGGNPIGYSGPVAEGYAAWLIVLLLVVFSMWIERGGKG